MKNNISISVEVVYSPKHSSETQFFYIYFITMHNLGTQSAQLLRRHFYIKNAHGEQQEIEGDGVVGEHPVIAPEQIYRYHSGVPISFPPGTMHGNYTFQAADGTEFNAEIPVFDLLEPAGYVPANTSSLEPNKRVLN